MFPLFPLNDTQEFTIDGFFSSNEYLTLLQKMKNIPHLELAALDIGPVMELFDQRNRGMSGGTVEI